MLEFPQSRVRRRKSIACSRDAITPPIVMRQCEVELSKGVVDIWCFFEVQLSWIVLDPGGRGFGLIDAESNKQRNVSSLKLRLLKNLMKFSLLSLSLNLNCAAAGSPSYPVRLLVFFNGPDQLIFDSPGSLVAEEYNESNADV